TTRAIDDAAAGGAESSGSTESTGSAGAAESASTGSTGSASDPQSTASRSPDASPGESVAATVPESHYTPQKSIDPNERAANAFAGELLIPDAGAATVVARWAGDAPLDVAVRLSSHYGVSAFAATVKLQLLEVFDKPTIDALRDRLRTLDHVARYDELGLPALDDELQRQKDAGGGVRCAPRARTVVRRLLGELSAA
ncbi:MAG: ImmA/IrrE family metallo-endopeptidase, partial [Solirubrobacteraceae bacterium]|nr:ImmA/IrrE family metallo-endopeptidase [Solirubrobacteraceae bacterium]